MGDGIRGVVRTGARGWRSTAERERERRVLHYPMGCTPLMYLRAPLGRAPIVLVALVLKFAPRARVPEIERWWYRGDG